MVWLFAGVILARCDLSVCRFDKEESAAGAATSDRKTLCVYKTLHLGGSADRYLWDQRSPGLVQRLRARRSEWKGEREHQVWGLSVGVSVGGDLEWLGFRLPAAEKGKRKIFFQRLQYENSPKINDKLGHDEVKEEKKHLAQRLFSSSSFSSFFALQPRMLSVKGGVAQEVQSTWQLTRELCLSKVAPSATLNKSQRFISRQLPQGEERGRRREWDVIGWSQNRKHQPLNYGPSSLVLHGWRHKNYIATHPGCYFIKSAWNFFPFFDALVPFWRRFGWFQHFQLNIALTCIFKLLSRLVWGGLACQITHNAQREAGQLDLKGGDAVVFFFPNCLHSKEEKEEEEYLYILFSPC